LLSKKHNPTSAAGVHREKQSRADQAGPCPCPDPPSLAGKAPVATQHPLDHRVIARNFFISQSVNIPHTYNRRRTGTYARNVKAIKNNITPPIVQVIP
jgi:hypothetical protein